MLCSNSHSSEGELRQNLDIMPSFHQQNFECNEQSCVDVTPFCKLKNIIPITCMYTE